MSTGASSSSLPQALAARALVSAGLQLVELSSVELTVDLGDRQAVVGLGALHRILALVEPDEQAQRVQAWAQAVVSSLQGLPVPGDVRDRLVPRLLADADPRLFTIPLAPGLHLALAEDLPDRCRFLTPFDLPRHQLSMAAARHSALTRLARVTPPPKLTDGSSLAGVWTWTVGDGLDASRLLLAGQAAASVCPGAAGALGVVPARDLCWWLPVRGPADVQAGVQLVQRLPDLRTLPYALSPALWWVSATGEDPAEVVLHRTGSTVRSTVRAALPAGLLRALGNLPAGADRPPT